ncbi:fimbrial protein [Klebsiella quasipneumoniae]|uniref:fimbrial protein n=1 Tax=Klebsiella quasipneumoniae TaxID=1463165 RepID=UPI001299B87F|nr:fimbrial protein [Klebsiella quasipneumoniae]MRE65631.1 fimbrial protein [Klebsiella quasipneumoniae]
MKKQPRFITILIGALLSGVAFQATAANTINPNSGTSAQGAGGQITFNGSITDSSCNVDSNSSGQPVDLGKWASNYFTGTGAETTKTPFHIKVKDCPASVTTVAVLFDGAREQTDTSLLAINGGAKGVAIKLYEHDQTTAVSLGKTTAKQTVTPGSSGGTANFNMIYN